ncbi:hypothetical protein BHM03_00059738 [Ensete ventricosum]|nr:hypothetical protein BHM03_00059738 [Ensete ventricosum]
MERRNGSVKVTVGPTMPWREITTHLRAVALTGGPWLQPAAPVGGGVGRGQPPPYRGPWSQPAAPCSQPREIVYPCIPDPNGEDEGGQASSSLAVSTRWISATKLLQFGLATLA